MQTECLLFVFFPVTATNHTKILIDKINQLAYNISIEIFVYIQVEVAHTESYALHLNCICFRAVTRLSDRRFMKLRKVRNAPVDEILRSKAQCDRWRHKFADSCCHRNITLTVGRYFFQAATVELLPVRAEQFLYSFYRNLSILICWIRYFG